MRKMINITKTFAIIALVLGFFFVPVFGNAKAITYNYDFWKNIIPSAEGIAHDETYYGNGFKYHKNNEYDKVVSDLTKLLDEYKLSEIKELVITKKFARVEESKYNTAIQLLTDNLELASSVKEEVKSLILEKQEYEKDENLYRQLDFNSLTDIQVYGDKIYVLNTPISSTVSNITGSATISEATQLIVIDGITMEWEVCIQEFGITDDVKNQFDNYYVWNRLSFDSVATGNNHSIAVDTSGNLWAWGSNEYGQLGVDPSEASFYEEPKQVSWIGDESGIKYSYVFAAGDASFAVDASGRLWGFGKNDNNLISSEGLGEASHVKTLILSNIKDVSVADDHIYAITGDGSIYCWGDNKDGLLIAPKVSNTIQNTPIALDFKFVRYDVLNNNKEIPLTPTKILTSKTHTVVIDDEGSLWVWGRNEKGQLGTGNTEFVSVPTLVTLRKNNVTVKVESIALGDEHTALVDKLGGLWTFGSNDHLQLGYEGGSFTATPYAYHHEIEYTQVFAFANSTIAVDIDNISYVFGQNNNYQLGFETEEDNIPYTQRSGIAHSKIIGSNDGVFSIDVANRLWIWGSSTTKLGLKNTEAVKEPVYSEHRLVLKNIALSRLENSDIYKRAIYVAHSEDETKASVYLRNAVGIAVNENFIYISDTQNSRILKINKQTYIVEDVCLTPNNSTFKQLNLDSSVYQPSTLRQFKPTKVTVSPTGRVYAIAEQVYEGIIEFNKQGDYNRYLGQNDVVANPLKELLRDYLSDEQLATFALTLPPLFTSISTDSKGFIYATSYPDTESGSIAGQNMVKAINTSGKDSMKRNGYVLPNGDAVYISSSSNANAILGPSYLVDVTINESGNFTVVDEVRGRLFTYDSDGNLLYIAGAQPGGTKQNASGLAENIIKPVAIDYLYRTYTDGQKVTKQEELIVVADQQSKSLMFYKTTEFGRLVNQATAAYNAGVDTAEKAQAVRSIWEEVRQMNTNYELAYLGIGKCILVESDYVDTDEEKLKLYQESMENFKLAHNGTYYSKAFGRYRDHVLKDHFGWIMTAGVIIAAGAVGLFVFKTIKKNQAKKIKVQGGE